jgi:hypothetical protein
MVVLSLDVLSHISQFVSLKDRYYWSVCHRRFKITAEEWQQIARYYVLDNIDELSKVCLRQHYSVSITQKPDCLWSNHLREPFTVWSPWTLQKLCTVSSTKAFFRFRDRRFLLFVQEAAQLFGLKSSSITRRFRNDLCVYATIWSLTTAQIPIMIQYKHKKSIRRCFMPTFQALHWTKLRCLLEFRVCRQQLKLRVKSLEFSTL